MNKDQGGRKERLEVRVKRFFRSYNKEGRREGGALPKGEGQSGGRWKEEVEAKEGKVGLEIMPLQIQYTGYGSNMGRDGWLL